MGYSVQRANVFKRISAWLFDIILLAIVAVMCAWGLAALTGFDVQYDRLLARYDAIAQEHQLDREALFSASYSELTEEERQTVETANAALASDAEALYAYQMVTQLMILIVSLGIFAAHLLLEFLLPLRLGDGRTLGKKIFGIAVMRRDGVRINHISLFIRAILGKYAVETMLPVMALILFMIGSLDLIALAVVLILFLAQAVLLFSTRDHTLIHDLLADTLMVDFASQMIFPTEEAMIAYKQAAHAEKVAHDGGEQYISKGDLV